MRYSDSETSKGRQTIRSPAVPPARRAVRAALSEALAEGSMQGPFLETALVAQAEMAVDSALLAAKLALTKP